jgi:hypothetical protein
MSRKHGLRISDFSVCCEPKFVRGAVSGSLWGCCMCVPGFVGGLCWLGTSVLMITRKIIVLPTCYF